MLLKCVISTCSYACTDGRGLANHHRLIHQLNKDEVDQIRSNQVLQVLPVINEAQDVEQELNLHDDSSNESGFSPKTAEIRQLKSRIAMLESQQAIRTESSLSRSESRQSAVSSVSCSAQSTVNSLVSLDENFPPTSSEDYVIYKEGSTKCKELLCFQKDHFHLRKEFTTNANTRGNIGAP